MAHPSNSATICTPLWISRHAEIPWESRSNALQSSHVTAFKMRIFVYMRAATAKVVTMMHPYTVRARYGCSVNGSVKSGVTPLGGVKPGSLGDGGGD